MRSQQQREKRLRNPTPKESVRRKISAARTVEQILEAKNTLRAWIDEYPEDRFEFGRYASDLRRKEIRLDEKGGLS